LLCATASGLELLRKPVQKVLQGFAQPHPLNRVLILHIRPYEGISPLADSRFQQRQKGAERIRGKAYPPQAFHQAPCRRHPA
jgi:hypothetical protein